MLFKSILFFPVKFLYTRFIPIIILKRFPLLTSPTRLSDKYHFEKPNESRALNLMNAAAVEVMKDLPDLSIAYGVSDEYRSADPPVFLGKRFGNSCY